ncbi:MAG: isoquinoline 1-oxidoreductase beta subunit [Candidatus Azotimanducaceae bacterium]|jgi:isoquinoline 1-oxidoreductase beta subunit|tara:strand:+ start:6721 stop:8961 length:2241 start_codon:yes stop_codon:yes gene_type:complete
MNSKKISRRSLFKITAIAGGGLVLKLSLPVSAMEDDVTTLVKSSELNFYVQIASDGQITIYAPNPEMGQGIKTTLPMIIAEEMGASWDDVEVVLAPIDPVKFGLQGSGGSMSVTRNFDAMRRMGASAREMLIGAASELMEVERGDLKAEASQVIHGSGRSMTFGQLASVAAQQPVPVLEQLSFKDPRSYSIIGTSVGSVDNLVIATGQSKFGIDVDAPGMKFASYTRCPRPGGKAVSFNKAEIKALAGVIDAFILQPDARSGKASMAFLDGLAALQGGVAIVGEDTWSVFAAKAKLQVKWDESQASTDQWSKMVSDARAIAAKGGGEVKLAGPSVVEALADSSNRVLDGFYEFPYVAHVCMEPMNCTVDFKKAAVGKPASMEIWLGSQFPNQVKEIAENMLGVKQENVKVHGLRMGGGFGRRAVHDFAAEAMAISHQSGLPVKLTWTRTDDIHNDYFRVGGFENMKGAVSPDGKLAAWDQHYIGFADKGKPVIGSGLRGNELPMVAFDNASIRQTMMPVATACGAWRAPGSNTNAFVEQSFIHELANLAERDHVEFLTELMGSRRWIKEGNISALNTGRAIDVIKLAAAKAGWGRTMPEGTGLGLAFYFCHAAHVAEVAEVSVDAERNFNVKRVTVAVDVGPIINMSGAINQVQGSIVDGLSTMALQEITMQNGRIEQDNFHQYPVMRIASTPEIDVHFIQSDNKPTGLGEPALPPLAPAVTNAIFAATGDRIRSMPLSRAGYKLV